MNLSNIKLQVVLLCAAAILSVWAEDNSERMVILDKRSYLRTHQGWKTPQLITEDGTLKVPEVGSKRDRKPMPQWQSPPPSEKWKEADFDEEMFWARQRVPVGVYTYLRGDSMPLQWYQVCARGSFYVDDPSKVKGLKIKAEVSGGAVLYLNGKEIKRTALPSGKLTRDTMAEPYPKETYVNEKNELILDTKHNREKYRDKIEARTRVVEATVPSDMLHKGKNVIAVDIRRAPQLEIKGMKRAKAGYRGYWGYFNLCRLLNLEATADPGSAVRQNVEPSKGLYLWVPHPLETVFIHSWGEPAEKPFLTFYGARGGTFSARFVVSNNGGSVKSLNVSAQELKGEAGTIPLRSIKVRYAKYSNWDRSWLQPGRRRRETRFDILDNSFPPDILPKKTSTGEAASVPVWITINVPKETKAGKYSSSITVAAEGMEKKSVAVTLNVAEWEVPGPDKYISNHNVYQSHESTALHYKVPFWSDKHLELMAESLKLVKQCGNEICPVHLVCNAYCQGNSRTMVYWIDKGNGTYDHDFTPFDTYLNLYEKVCGKPNVLLVSVWVPSCDQVKKKGAGTSWAGPDDKPRNQVKFTVKDPKTGEFSSRPLPNYGTDKALQFWKPVLLKVRERLEKKGWWDVAFLGTASDNMPMWESVKMFKTIWPDGRWMASTHQQPSFVGKHDKPDANMPVNVLEHVWGAGHLYIPGTKKHAYPNPGRGGKIITVFPRTGQGFIDSLTDGSALVKWYMSPEGSLQGGLLGIGRVGADFFPLPGKGRGRFDSLAGSSHLGFSASVMSFVSAGEKGPVPNEKYQLFVEGQQIREAIMYLRTNAPKAGPEITKKAFDHLDKRAAHYGRTKIGWKDQYALWYAFMGSGWQKRNEELFDLCAQVVKAIGK